MEFKHKTVLLNEVLDNLNIIPKGIYVDGTLGGGGHSLEICKKLSKEGTLIGIDRDNEALDAAKKVLSNFICKKHYVSDNYSNIKAILEENNIKNMSGAVLDLGVSSFHLDNPQRGFSYMQDAPLDMRMNAKDKLTAKEIINSYEEKELYRIIKEYGEEKWAARIVEFIIKERKKAEIKTTFTLVEIIKAAIPKSARREGPHPAKRTFQAIRIEVNDELIQLEKAVNDFVNLLAPKGRLAIITFHSLEDRIVKNAFNNFENPCECPKGLPFCACGKKPIIKRINKKPILPKEQEIIENPRARSAKLRVVERNMPC